MATTKLPTTGPARSRSPRKAQPRRRPSRAWRFGFLLAVGLIALMAATSIGVFVGYVRSMPPIEQLENYNPPEITRVFDRSGSTPIGDYKIERRQVVRINEIPERLRNAFIAIEDERYYNHFGVDPIGVLRAAFIFFKTGSVRQGASTITIQMAGNIIPTLDRREKTIGRKVREAIYAIQIERRYSKDQILEFYLNQISFGGVVHGVWAAAQTYFGKNLDQLTLAECATLAAMPKAPSKFNPRTNKKDAIERRNLVLHCMYNQGMIKKTDLEQAVAEPLTVHDGLRSVSRYPSFLNALEWDLNNYYGVTSDTLRTRGFQITATVDPQIQEICEDSLREGLKGVEKMWQDRKPLRLRKELKDLGGTYEKNQLRLMKITKVREDSVDVSFEQYHGTIPRPEDLPFHDPERCLKAGEYLDVYIKDVNARTGKIEGTFGYKKPVEGSIVVLDAHTGEVLALAGGDQTLGDWNNAIAGGRQAGSCFKPFFYAAAFERGFSPSGVIVDERVEYSIGNKAYKPVNYERGDTAFVGPITLIEALEHSRNVVTIRLFEALGIKKALETVRRFDFTLPERPSWDLKPEISICLGTIDVSPFQLAAAYQPFANLGWGIRPQFFRSIVDKSGRISIPIKKHEGEVISPIAAYQTQYLLHQVVLNGTGKLEIGDKLSSPPYPPICGKTGTTTDCRDVWFTGFTPDLVIVCQAGFNPPHPMGDGMTGGRVVGPMWRDTFKKIIATRKNWRMAFDAPAEEGMETVNICAVSGKRAADTCYSSGHRIYPNVPFERGKAPRDVCTGGPDSALIAPVSSQYSYLQAPRVGIAHYPTTPYVTH